MERDCFYNELKYVRDYACKAAGLDPEIAGWKTAVDAMTKQLADAQEQVGSYKLVNDMHLKTVDKLSRQVEALQAQLPAEMQGCTILFKECEKGHGRLVATNWRDHGCQTCEVEALQARVKELEESRDAWKASQECSEKAYMALVNQIPAERFDYDPVNVALLDGAKEQEIIGRKQIADLQDLLKWTDENREQWRKLCQEAQSQLTQRTAELEAAANYYKQPSKNGGVYSVSGGHIGNLMDWCKDNLKHCKFSGPDEDNLDLDLVQTAQQIPQLKTELSQLKALVRALSKDFHLEDMRKAEAEAQKWEAEGDMYGWNFHQGRASGIREEQFIVYRIMREHGVDPMKALDATTPATTKT